MSVRRYKTKEAAQMVDEFNKAHPVGSEIEYEEVLGVTGKKKYTVRYPAEVRNELGGYAIAMVFMAGFSGCVCVDHITGWTNWKSRTVETAK